MSPAIERRSKADWRAAPSWVRNALAGRTQRGSSDRGSDADNSQAEEPGSPGAAKEWLRAAARRLAGLEGEPLIDAVGRIEDVYDQFPELELETPRRALVDDLRSPAETAAHHAAIPLLMAYAVLGASPSVAVLLDRMARSGHGDAIARTVAILARRRVIASGEIAAALDELCREGRVAAALAVIAQALGQLGVDRGTAAVEFSAALKRALAAGAASEVDPSGLTRTILSARNRLQPGTRTQPNNRPGRQLLALAERVAAKLQRRALSPPPVAATTAPWPTRRFGFVEFAAQWPAICGVAVEWLSLMTVGDAGERNDAGVCAKPEQAGHLVFGPFLKLGAGDYRVRICWNAGRKLRTDAEGQPVATIEVVSRNGKTYLTQRELGAEDFECPEHELRFCIGNRPPQGSPIEVRVWTSGAVPLTVSSIAVELVGVLPTAAATTGKPE
jgi:hypothetical protein